MDAVDANGIFWTHLALSSLYISMIQNGVFSFVCMIEDVAILNYVIHVHEGDYDRAGYWSKKMNDETFAKVIAVLRLFSPDSGVRMRVLTENTDRIVELWRAGVFRTESVMKLIVDEANVCFWVLDYIACLRAQLHANHTKTDCIGRYILEDLIEGLSSCFQRMKDAKSF